jgi:hypothetical protein
MYRLYMAMKERSSDEITENEIAVASGKKILDPGGMSDFLQTLESTSMTIQKAFEKQVKTAAVSSFIFRFMTTLMNQRVLGIRVNLKKCW